MSANMEVDVFAKTAYGKAALQQLGSVSKNFRLYYAGWIGNDPSQWKAMKITGAEFRVAKKGKHAGKLSVKVQGTDRTVIVTVDEMNKFETDRGFY